MVAVSRPAPPPPPPPLFRPPDRGFGGTASHVDGDASESYLDWRVGISKEMLGFGLDVSYWDAENEEVFCGLRSQHCRGTVVGTISRRF